MLEALACLASVEGEPRRAAVLWGGVDAERRRTQRERYGAELEEFERDVAEAPAQIDPQDFMTAWSRGRREGHDGLVARELASLAPSDRARGAAGRAPDEAVELS